MISARLKFLFRAIVSVTLIFLVVRKLDRPALQAILFRLESSWAIAGFACSFLIIVGLALRWRIFLRQQQIEISSGTVLCLTWSGQFFNSILPGSTGGDVMKIYQLCRIAPNRKAAAVATIFADRLCALLALLALAVIGFLIEPAPLYLLQVPAVSGIVSASFFGGVLILGLLAAWGLFALARATPWREHIERTLLSARSIFTSGPECLAAIALAFAIYLANFLVVYLFARSLGIGITPPQVALMVPVILFLVLLPVTINGHGLRELLLIGYFTHLDISLVHQTPGGVQEIAVALSLVLVSNDLLWSLPGGIWYLVNFRTRPRAPAG